MITLLNNEIINKKFNILKNNNTSNKNKIYKILNTIFLFCSIFDSLFSIILFLFQKSCNFITDNENNNFEKLYLCCYITLEILIFILSMIYIHIKYDIYLILFYYYFYLICLIFSFTAHFHFLDILLPNYLMEKNRNNIYDSKNNFFENVKNFIEQYNHCNTIMFRDCLNFITKRESNEVINSYYILSFFIFIFMGLIFPIVGNILLILKISKLIKLKKYIPIILFSIFIIIFNSLSSIVMGLNTNYTNEEKFDNYFFIMFKIIMLLSSLYCLKKLFFDKNLLFFKNIKIIFRKYNLFLFLTYLLINLIISLLLQWILYILYKNTEEYRKKISLEQYLDDDEKLENNFR